MFVHIQDSIATGSAYPLTDQVWCGHMSCNPQMIDHAFKSHFKSNWDFNNITWPTFNSYR